MSENNLTDKKSPTEETPLNPPRARRGANAGSKSPEKPAGHYASSDEELADYFKLAEIRINATRRPDMNRDDSKKDPAEELEAAIHQKQIASVREGARLDFSRLCFKYALNRAETLILAVCAYKYVMNESRPTDVGELLRAACGNDYSEILACRRNCLGRKSKLIGKNLISIWNGGREYALGETARKFLFGKPFVYEDRRLGVRPARRTARSGRITGAAEIYERLSQYVVGQERAKRMLSAAAFQHLVRARLKNSGGKDGRLRGKSNVLLVGPTGSGKTHLCRSLAKVLDVPVVTTDATSYSETGYVGDNVENMIKLLLNAAGGDRAKAETGIIFIDEIDKIAARNPGGGHSTSRDVSGECVQQELLKMLEGRVVTAQEYGIFANRTSLNTEKVLFIAGGAFSGLDKIIQNRIERAARGSAIGFARGEEKCHAALDASTRPTTADLVEYGMIPELVGRLPVVCALDDLTKEELADIILNPKNSLLGEYNEILAAVGMEIRMAREAALATAEEALKFGTGARGLRAIFEDFVAKLIFRAEPSDKKEKHIVTLMP